MSAIVETSLSAYCREAAVRAKRGAAELAQLSGERKNAWLKESAQVLRERIKELLAANEKDVAAAPAFGITEAAIDRLQLTPSRIEEIAVGLEAVAALPDPVGEVIESSIRPNGLQVLKTRVPLGVVFFIYAISCRCRNLSTWLFPAEGRT
jgi:glutamate-5-semialdehyde dehydrogenase